MSILIKNIEMPKACSDCFAERCIGSDFGCDILGFDDANTTCFTKERRKDCPLIEILPHGRLIDADALENEAQMRLLECNKYDNQFQKPYEVMRAIALAPTIIPAEEDEI